MGDRSGRATAARLRRPTPLASLVEPRDQAAVAPYSSVSNKPGSYARIDNPLGLGNNFLCSTFLEIGRAISQCAGRAPRIDRCPPALADRAYLNSISLIVDRCHCFGAKAVGWAAGTRMGGDAGQSNAGRGKASPNTSSSIPNVCRRRPDEAKTPARCCLRWGFVRTDTALAPGGFGSLRRPAFVDFETRRFRNLYQTAHS